MSIRENAREIVETRKEWLEEAEKAANMVMELPLEIQELEGSADVNHYYDHDGKNLVKKERLSLTFQGGDEAVVVLKKYGVTGLTSQFSTWTGDYHYTDGKLTEVGFDNIVKVNNIDPPYDCKVIKYTEKVTRYREECEPVESKS